MSFYSLIHNGFIQAQVVIPQFIAHVIATTTLDQVMLGILGVTAIRLSQDHRESFQKWAPVVGLCGQPFWLYATYTKELWVMFLICCLYTWSWWKGFKRWHLTKRSGLIANVKEADIR